MIKYLTAALLINSFANPTELTQEMESIFNVAKVHIKTNPENNGTPAINATNLLSFCMEQTFKSEENIKKAKSFINMINSDKEDYKEGIVILNYDVFIDETEMSLDKIEGVIACYERKEDIKLKKGRMDSYNFDKDAEVSDIACVFVKPEKENSDYNFQLTNAIEADSSGQ